MVVTSGSYNQMFTSFGPSLNTRVSQANMLGIHLTTFSQRSSYVTLLPQPPSSMLGRFILPLTVLNSLQIKKLRTKGDSTWPMFLETFQEIFTLLPDIVDVVLNSSLPVYTFITVPYGLKMNRHNSLECSDLEELISCLTVST